MADIICYWDQSIRLWTMFAVDNDGYQLWDTCYYPNREQLAYALNHF